MELTCQFVSHPVDDLNGFFIQCLGLHKAITNWQGTGNDINVSISFCDYTAIGVYTVIFMEIIINYRNILACQCMTVPNETAWHAA